MKLVAAATVLALSTNFAQASRSARRKQRLTSLYEKSNACFAESICAKPCAEIADLDSFLGMPGRRCKMCASAKLKKCGHAEADEETVVDLSEKPSASFENEPDSREKCLYEKCGCVGPLHKLNKGEKKACKMCARKNECFRKQSRDQAAAKLKKSEAAADVPMSSLILGHVHNTVDKLPENNNVEQVVKSEVYTADEGISAMESSEAAAIFGMSSTGNRPLRIMSQQQQQPDENETPGLRIPSSGGNPNYPLRMPTNNDKPEPPMSQQTIGRFTFSDKFKRNGWNPFQPEDAPAEVVDVQPDSEEDADYLDDIYTDSDDMSDALKAGADYEFETEGKEADFENDDGVSDYFQFYESEEDEDADYDAEYAENLENSENLDDDIYTDGGDTRNGAASLDSGSFNPFSNEQHAEVEAWENPANNALHHESLIGELPESMQSSNANMKQGDSYPTGLAYGKENSEENKYDHKNTRRTQRKSLRKTTKKAKRVGCMSQVAETCTMCHVPVDGSVESWKVLKGLNKQHDGRKACMACINEIKSSC